MEEQTFGKQNSKPVAPPKARQSFDAATETRDIEPEIAPNN